MYMYVDRHKLQPEDRSKLMVAHHLECSCALVMAQRLLLLLHHHHQQRQTNLKLSFRASSYARLPHRLKD